MQERLDVFVFHIILLGRLDFKAVSCRHLSRRLRIRLRVCLNWNRFLNRLLDQLSNEGMRLFCKQEVIHELTPAVYIYTIGPGGNVGATFTGSIAGSVLTVSYSR